MNLKKIIGNKEIFAVEYEITAVYESFIYGKFCYWIDKKKIGKYDEGVTISDMLWRIPDLVNYNGKREQIKLYQLDVLELFDMLNSTLFGEGNEKYDQIAEEEEWARFDIGIHVDIFYECKIFLIESMTKARIVFSINKNINELYLEKGIVDDVFKKLYTDFNELYDKYVLHR